MEKVTLGGGCFWCLEAIFKSTEGIHNVKNGYMGGEIKNPTYEFVCTGNSGYVEVVQFDYDIKNLSFKKILEIFFTIHDPTTLNQQGNDIGSQYKSIIFYHSKSQEDLAKKHIQELRNKKLFNHPIVTELTKATIFYEAEKYHEDYYNKNKEQPYCKIIIEPKLDKFKNSFKEIIKNDGF